MDDDWSKAEDLPPQLNEGFTMALWVDGAGNYYFTREQGLMVARCDEGECADAISLAPQFGPPVGDAAHGFVSPDGRSLFFCRDGEIYWVDASILGVHR